MALYINMIRTADTPPLWVGEILDTEAGKVADGPAREDREQALDGARAMVKQMKEQAGQPEPHGAALRQLWRVRSQAPQGGLRALKGARP